MRIIVVLIAATIWAGCTKQNPNRCCVDEADCMAAGLSTVSACDNGLVCRGHECVAETCTTSQDCEASAPYCESSGLCSMSCTADTECPGFAQDASDKFCVSGSCGQCRAGMPSDCPANLPVCDAAACRGCRDNSECSSGVCKADGSCAMESEIAYVDPGGSASSDCTRLQPCSLARGLNLTPTRTYVELASGTYTNSGTVLVTGTRVLVGTGATKPSLRNSMVGPILTIDTASDVTLDGLEFTGATTAQGNAVLGHGVECPSSPAGTRMLRLRRSVFRQNAASGVHAVSCNVIARQTTFSDNQFHGLALTDSMADVDQCLSTGNVGAGFNFDGGLYTMTNSYSYRNGDGIDIFSVATTNRLEFNTIVDNSNVGVSCNTSGMLTTAPNNIVARNLMNTDSGTCTFPGSILITDVSQLHFKSPDSAPYDYHLGTGSVAVDAATASTVDHDFDGDPRPKGNGRDVGADEAQ